MINNTLPEMANKDVSFTADEVTYAASTVDSKDLVSINYSWTGSKHKFEWASNPDGNTSMVDLIQVGLHFGEETSAPYPSYDVNADGIVDIVEKRLLWCNVSAPGMHNAFHR